MDGFMFSELAATQSMSRALRATWEGTSPRLALGGLGVRSYISKEGAQGGAPSTWCVQV